jgi:putative membrane protein insertion efficiency factor
MIRAALLFVIRVYQLTLSRLLGPSCRFEPSCSHYTATCIDRFGALRGSWLGMKRIGRCHPFNPGGFDPPPHPDRETLCSSHEAHHG